MIPLDPIGPLDPDPADSKDSALDEIAQALDQIKELQSLSLTPLTPEQEKKLEAIELMAEFLNATIREAIAETGLTQEELNTLQANPDLMTAKERRFFKRLGMLQEQTKVTFETNQAVAEAQKKAGKNELSSSQKKGRKGKFDPTGARKGWKQL